MTEADLIAQQDQQRTARAFVSFIQTATGLDDHTDPSTDGTAYNNPAQYQVVSPYGVAVEGKPVSTQQGFTIPTPLLIGGLIVLALLATGHLKV